MLEAAHIEKKRKKMTRIFKKNKNWENETRNEKHEKLRRKRGKEASKEPVQDGSKNCFSSFFVRNREALEAKHQILSTREKEKEKRKKKKEKRKKKKEKRKKKKKRKEKKRMKKKEQRIQKKQEKWKQEKNDKQHEKYKFLEVLVLEPRNLKLSWSYRFPKYFRLSSSIPAQPCLAKPSSWSLTVIL